MTRVATAVGAAVGVAVVASCARQEIPQGGPVDRYPPVVVTTEPDTFANLSEAPERIRIEFSERISEEGARGRLQDAVIISPRFGEVEVSHKSSALEVKMSGGFPLGHVYRVTVLPIVRDLFSNPMDAPFEFVFSTGGDFHPNAIGGLIVDRITGLRLEATDVVLRPQDADSASPIEYLARTDTSGIYALRFVPPGAYDLEAFQDIDRNRGASPFEPQGQRRLVVGTADTVFADVVVLIPDTTAAILASVQLQDSMTLRLGFDDYLEPEASLDGVVVSLQPVPDTTDQGVSVPPDPPAVLRLLHPPEYAAYADSLARALAEARAAEDSLRADSLGTDSLGVDTLGVDPARGDPPARAVPPGRIPGPGANIARPVAAAGPPTLPDNRPLPLQELVAVLEGALPEGGTYRVIVTGVVNINGLGEGRGELRVRRELPPDTSGVILRE